MPIEFNNIGNNPIKNHAKHDKTSNDSPNSQELRGGSGNEVRLSEHAQQLKH